MIIRYTYFNGTRKNAFTEEPKQRDNHKNTPVTYQKKLQSKSGATEKGGEKIISLKRPQKYRDTIKNKYGKCGFEK